MGLTKVERARRKNLVGHIFGKEYFEIDPARSALLVIDMQNSFVEESAIFEVPKGREIIPNINRIIDKARAVGVPVIWTQSDHSRPVGGLILKRHPVVAESKELWLGDYSQEIFADMVQPSDDDHRVVKHKFDAFHETDMKAILRNIDVDTVTIIGVATEVCCESTARSAFFNDYKVVFLSDATAAFQPEMQESTCARIEHMFGRVVATEELLHIWDSDGESQIETSIPGNRQGTAAG